MTFSQGWDAGFKAVMIYIGVVFVWLIFIESRFDDRSLSVLAMNSVAALLAVGFFISTWRRCRREREAARTEISALMSEVE